MNEYSYIGRKPCGCLVAAVSCTWDADDMASALGNWVKQGLTIERVSDDVVRAEFTTRCPHVPQQLALFAESDET